VHDAGVPNSRALFDPRRLADEHLLKKGYVRPDLTATARGCKQFFQPTRAWFNGELTHPVDDGWNARRQIAVLYRMLDVYVEGFSSLMHEIVHTARRKAPLVRALWCYFVAACEQDASAQFPTSFGVAFAAAQREVSQLQAALHRVQKKLLQTEARHLLTHEQLLHAARATTRHDDSLPADAQHPVSSRVRAAKTPCIAVGCGVACVCV